MAASRKNLSRRRGTKRKRAFKKTASFRKKSRGRKMRGGACSGQQFEMVTKSQLNYDDDYYTPGLAPGAPYERIGKYIRAISDGREFEYRTINVYDNDLGRAVYKCAGSGPPMHPPPPPPPRRAAQPQDLIPMAIPGAAEETAYIKGHTFHEPDQHAHLERSDALSLYGMYDSDDIVYGSSYHY